MVPLIRVEYVDVTRIHVGPTWTGKIVVAFQGVTDEEAITLFEHINAFVQSAEELLKSIE